jgi:hypothetical protein
MGFLAAVPILGQALDGVFSGLDKLFTSDDERLKAQHQILLAFQPVILALVQAQAEFDRIRADVEKTALQSEDWFIRRSRPAMTWVTFGWWMFTEITSHPHADKAFYAFLLVSGIWTATRGGAQIIETWMGKKNGGTK